MRNPRSAAPLTRVLPLAAAIALVLAWPARAATISVNDAGEGSVPGKCTLSDAVIAVNTSVVRNACAAGNGNNDTIDLSLFTTPTTITFMLPSIADPNSALSISKPVAIKAGVDANGNPLVTLTRSTVSGTPNFRLISNSADLYLHGLHLSNGVAPDLGGAVNATGTASLTVTNSIVSGNTAASSGGGLATDCGYMYVIGSVISGNSADKNGGGLYASDYELGGHCVTTITIASSKISGNQATIGSGGGVYSFYGYVSATYTTVDSNTAGGTAGGGLYAFIDVSLSNSTVSNNSIGMHGGGLSAGQGIYLYNTTVSGNLAYDSGGLTAYRVSMFFSTIAGNRVTPQNYPLGGMSFLDSCHAVGTIIAGNMGGQIIGEAAVSGDHNLVGSNGPGQSITLPGDTINCNPNLGPLADNGGPTKTMALGDGSCAINAGPTAAPDYPSDQRGRKFERRFGAATDIGAFEVQSNDRIFYDGFNT
jgi:hypothetical protein